MISKKQLNCVLVSALAVLSLLVSSISACACAHHQEQVKASESCHSQSHSGHDEIAQTTDAKTSIDEGCVCFVSQPSPYALAKSGKKISTDQASVSDIPADKVLIKTHLRLVETREPLVDTNPELYLSLLTVSGPSRAPPRP